MLGVITTLKDFWKVHSLTKIGIQIELYWKTEIKFFKTKPLKKTYPNRNNPKALIQKSKSLSEPSNVSFLSKKLSQNKLKIRNLKHRFQKTKKSLSNNKKSKILNVMKFLSTTQLILTNCHPNSKTIPRFQDKHQLSSENSKKNSLKVHL